MHALAESSAPGLVLLRRGKVRDVYELGDDRHLLLVATDRISAFDHILPTLVPDKGVILTRMSNFWFRRTAHLMPNHLVDPDPSWLDWHAGDEWCYDEVSGRCIVARKAKPLPVEAVVRGYLSGSAWMDYQRTGRVCGIELPPGLRESDRLPCPVYTPSTKEEAGGHDKAVTFGDTAAILGDDLAARVRAASLALYAFGAGYARRRGIIIADTKFEFGLVDGSLVLIDELFTPDSSRFWPVATYVPGRPQASLDKQPVRDYLERIGWDRTPPAPPLPDEVVRATASCYREVLLRLGADREEEVTGSRQDPVGKRGYR